MAQVPQILTLSASSPVHLRLEVNDDAVKAFGVSAICEMNHQRWVAQQENEVRVLSEFIGRIAQSVEVCSFSFYADKPEEALEIQPFYRPFKDRYSFFAQQGEMPEIHDRNLYSIGNHWPVGCSDQERAFCVLLERILTLWQEGRPDYESRLALISDYGARLDRLGAHNFSFWDGDYLYAYSSKHVSEVSPLCFHRLNEQRLNFGDGHQLAIDAEEGTDIVVVCNADYLRGAEPNLIRPGTVACFRSGKFLDSCEPITFWDSDN